MTLITHKPTSPGRRDAVSVRTEGLHKGAPYAALTEAQSRTGGRNHHGRITVRHRGGGHKQHYRIIDFKRDKEGIAAKVEQVNLVNTKGKVKAFRQRAGSRQGKRKAYVRLADGQTIDVSAKA